MRIKRLLSSAALSLTIFTACQAQDGTLTYKISGNGLPQPSYLYGTIHMICNDDFYMPATLQSAMDNVQSVYLELDLADSAKVAHMMKKVMEVPDNYRLSNYLTADEFKRVTGFYQTNFYLDPEKVDRMPPIVLISLMVRTFTACPSPRSYEHEITKMAAAANKPVDGLETVEDQLRALGKYTDSASFRTFPDFIDNPEKGREAYRRMVAAYKAKDVRALYEVIKSQPEFHKVEDAILINRNRSWIPVIEAASRKAPVLYAVGAGHLGGEDGVISLLRQKGYTVEPVR
ncbi:TraB/GumN family protein [Chitinophaga lutea]